jgi:hypothetical protein
VIIYRITAQHSISKHVIVQYIMSWCNISHQITRHDICSHLEEGGGVSEASPRALDSGGVVKHEGGVVPRRDFCDVDTMMFN